MFPPSPRNVNYKVIFAGLAESHHRRVRRRYLFHYINESDDDYYVNLFLVVSATYAAGKTFLSNTYRTILGLQIVSFVIIT